MNNSEGLSESLLPPPGDGRGLVGGGVVGGDVTDIDFDDGSVERGGQRRIRHWSSSFNGDDDLRLSESGGRDFIRGESGGSSLGGNDTGGGHGGGGGGGRSLSRGASSSRFVSGVLVRSPSYALPM